MDQESFFAAIKQLFNDFSHDLYSMQVVGPGIAEDRTPIRHLIRLDAGGREIFYLFPPLGEIVPARTVAHYFYASREKKLHPTDLSILKVHTEELRRIEAILSHFSKRLRSQSDDEMKEALWDQLECSLNAWDLNNFRAFPLHDLTNPISEVSMPRKIVHRVSRRIYPERRFVHESHRGKLCPFETPETDQIGLTLHLSQNAEIKDKQISNAHIDKGSEDSYYKPANMLSYSTGTVPFIQHTDGARAMMGGKNLKQAVPVINGEPPLIKTGIEKATATKSSRLIRALSDATVTEIKYDEIQGGFVELSNNGNVTTVPVSGPMHVHGVFAGTCYRERPAVQSGATVRAGDVIAEGSGIRDGELAIGANLLVGYMPWLGYNFEDGIVISSRLVEEDVLTTEHVYNLDWEIGPGESLITEFSESEAAKHNSTGEIRIGTPVRYGDLLAKKILAGRKKGGDEPQIQELRWDRYSPGQVIESKLVTKGRGSCLEISVYERRRVEVGDKLTGRHGNKGVVSLILPKEQMPYFTYKGTRRHLDALLSPMGVISRMNLGQVLETHMGWLAKEEKKDQYRMAGAPFQQVPIDEVWNDLEISLGNKYGKVRLSTIANDQPEEIGSYVIGYQYFAKLGHLARDKFHVRGITGPRNHITLQPVKGKKHGGGQRFGEMEVWALLAHDAPNLLLEFTTASSDLASAAPENYGGEVGSGLPGTFEAFLWYLRGLALELELLDKDGKVIPTERPATGLVREMRLRNLASDEIRRRSKGEITKKDKQNIDPFTNPSIFGAKPKDQRTKMGHLHFEVPVLNPLFEKSPPVTEVLKWFSRSDELAGPDWESRDSRRSISLIRKGIITGKKLKDGRFAHVILVKEGGKKVLVPILRSSRYSSEAVKLQTPGGKDINPETVVAMDLSTIVLKGFWLPGPKRKRARPKREKIWRQIKGLFISDLPVIPRAYRDSYNGRDSDLLFLYREVYGSATILRRWTKEKENDVRSTVAARARLYEALRSLFITGVAVRTRTKKGILQLLEGKDGLLRLYLLGKRCDRSARGVIVPDPTLPIDQFGLPVDMAAVLTEGIIPTDLLLRTKGETKEAERVISRAAAGDPVSRAICKAAYQEFFDREGTLFVLIRQPSLHKHSVLALKPIIRDDYCIGLPIMLCKGYNADFDGDTMAVFLPISKAAQQDCQKLLPSRNIFSAANGELLLHQEQDLALGYHELVDTADGPQRLQQILMPSSKSWNPPPNLRDALRQAAETMFCDGSRSTSPLEIAVNRANTEEFMQRLSQIQKVCLDAAFRSGTSFSMKELADISTPKKKREELFGDFVLQSHGAQGSHVPNSLQKELDALIRQKMECQPDNSISKMVLSGARGNWKQVRPTASNVGCVSFN